MNEAIYEKYKRAGSIASSAREHGANLIKEGASYLDVVTTVESEIKEQGAGIAFPANISVNELAAHFSPRHDDTALVFRKGDVVKIDVGAHVDGYIADTAKTVEVSTHTYDKMIRASREALNNAIAHIKADIPLCEIGKIIEDTIASFGYKSIDNLTGHSLQCYTLHSGLSIPNVADMLNRSKPNLEDVLAIEPFATDGAGHVISGQSSNIYRYQSSVRARFIRDTKARSLATKIHKRFNELPFAERWCADISSHPDSSLKRLIFAGCIKQYPQLIDANHGIVTQAEHTVIIHENDCEVTT